MNIADILKIIIVYRLNQLLIWRVCKRVTSVIV